MIPPYRCTFHNTQCPGRCSDRGFCYAEGAPEDWPKYTVNEWIEARRLYLMSSGATDDGWRSMSPAMRLWWAEEVRSPSKEKISG